MKKNTQFDNGSPQPLSGAILEKRSGKIIPLKAEAPKINRYLTPYKVKKGLIAGAATLRRMRNSMCDLWNECDTDSF